MAFEKLGERVKGLLGSGPNLPNLIEKLKQEQLSFGGLSLNLQRTCRVPGGQVNALPAGLGAFPIYKVSDFKTGCPKEWHDEGYFFPMYQQEAMWISFGRGYQQNPKALIVGAGNINAITAKPFDPSSSKFLRQAGKKIPDDFDIKLEKEQNYVAIPPQPWLDGWKGEDHQVYQFIAAKMGSGETVEGQITGEEKVGGIQFITYDPKPGKDLTHATTPHEYVTGGAWPGSVIPCLFVGLASAPTGETAGPTRRRMTGAISRRVTAPVAQSVTAMGLGRGGTIEQKIYPDPYGLDVWNEKPSGVDVIYMVSSDDFKQVTGYKAPPTPITYQTYQQYGLPWFELHDKKFQDTKGSDVFAKLKPVGEGKVIQK